MARPSGGRRKGRRLARVAAMGLPVACALTIAAAVLSLVPRFADATPDLQVVSMAESHALREEVRDAFVHTYDSYMRNAFPKDELLPLSCEGKDTLGSYALTLVDSLDTLAVLGNWTEFGKSAKWVAENLKFSESDETVSVFETNIRVLGGLLSAHMLSEGFKEHEKEICEGAEEDKALGAQCEDVAGLETLRSYEGGLLRVALDLGKRLAAAFEDPRRRKPRTRTGLPFGAVNLRHGVAANETELASTAGAGTLAVEFGVLSRLTGDPLFEDLAKSSMRAIWERRSPITGLVGAHINISSGAWTHLDSGIGASVDSYYEYLLKGSVLLGLDDFAEMFRQAYHSVEENIRVGPWYVEVNMENGVLVWPIFNALQAFWPGLQTLTASCSGDHKHFSTGKMNSKRQFEEMLTYQTIARKLSEISRQEIGFGVPSANLIHDSYGCENRSDASSHDLSKAIETHGAMFSVWKRHGATPEGYSLSQVEPQHGQRAYALRPELVESTYYLYLATRDPAYLGVGREMLAAIQSRCRAKCGYASLADVDTGKRRDHMESFFLAETLKYLYLLFDAGARGLWREHRVVRHLPYDYVFSTEGHIFPLTNSLSAFGKPGKLDTRPLNSDCRGRESGCGDVLEGYCRPLHPIWDAPRYARHYLPFEEAVAEPSGGSSAAAGQPPSGASQGSAGVLDIQALLMKSLMKLQSKINQMFGSEDDGEEMESDSEAEAEGEDAPAGGAAVRRNWDVSKPNARILPSLQCRKQDLESLLRGERAQAKAHAEPRSLRDLQASLDAGVISPADFEEQHLLMAEAAR